MVAQAFREHLVAKIARHPPLAAEPKEGSSQAVARIMQKACRRMNARVTGPN